MSAYTYLNELETKRLELERRASSPTIDSHTSERATWWDDLAEWWRKRHLGFGDGLGMASHCQAIANKIRNGGT